jgi:hypothetical protein
VSASSGPFAGGATATPVATLTALPAGSYVFTGYADLISNMASATTCSIGGGGGNTGNVRQYLSVAGQYVSVAPSGTWTLSAPSDVVMRCTVFNAAATWNVEARALTAVPVTGVSP